MLYEDLVNYFAAICDGAANPRKVMKTQRRPQSQKSSKVRQVQELRRSSAAQPHKAATDYVRKPKYGITWDYDDDDDTNPFTWR